MAWVLPQLENEGQDKRVESVWFPCADEGSTPSSSTKFLLYITDCQSVGDFFILKSGAISGVIGGRFGKKALLRLSIHQYLIYVIDCR